MNRIFGRYPSLNRGLVLLVTLLLPPTTAAAVLHAIAQERAALSAPSGLELREGPREETPTLVQDEDRLDDETEPAAPLAVVAEARPAPSVFVPYPEQSLGAPHSASPSSTLRAALVRRSAPRAPPA